MLCFILYRWTIIPSESGLPNHSLNLTQECMYPALMAAIPARFADTLRSTHCRRKGNLRLGDCKVLSRHLARTYVYLLQYSVPWRRHEWVNSGNDTRNAEMVRHFVR